MKCTGENKIKFKNQVQKVFKKERNKSPPKHDMLAREVGPHILKTEKINYLMINKLKMLISAGKKN